MIGIFSVILLVLEVLFFSSNPMEKILFLGGTTISVSLIIIYIYVIQPMKGQIRTSPHNQYYTSISPSFRPTIIPPSKVVKKTVMRGTCEYCGKKELMGFTCSYCDSYFCAEHRLPEKHDCIEIRRR
jgi:hypothetical protein